MCLDCDLQSNVNLSVVTNSNSMCKSHDNKITIELVALSHQLWKTHLGASSCNFILVTSYSKRLVVTPFMKISKIVEVVRKRTLFSRPKLTTTWWNGFCFYDIHLIQFDKMYTSTQQVHNTRCSYCSQDALEVELHILYWCIGVL